MDGKECKGCVVLVAENAHLKTLMQDIRNATGNQMERSLLDLREKWNDVAKLQERIDQLTE